MANIHNNICTNILGEILRKNKDKFCPLSKEEERALIKKYKKNPDKMKEQLIQHNIRIVFNLAKKYAPTSIDFDDLLARGFYGLCYAATKFDPKKNIKFVTYATPWVFKYIVNEYFDLDNKASKFGISLDKAISTDDDDGAATFSNIVHNYLNPNYETPSSTLSTDNTVHANEIMDICSDLEKWIATDKSFDKLDQEIFQRNLIEKDSIKAISSDNNVQYNTANRRKKELVQRLKDYLEEKWGITSVGEFLS